VTDERAFVVLMRVHLHFPEVGSLKGKRAELHIKNTPALEFVYDDTAERSQRINELLQEES
jgi:hypothetical protein